MLCPGGDGACERLEVAGGPFRLSTVSALPGASTCGHFYLLHCTFKVPMVLPKPSRVSNAATVLRSLVRHCGFFSRCPLLPGKGPRS